jgi:hypothetical protein
LTAGHQIPRGERVGEFLQAMGICAFQEGIGNLLESDAFLTHAVRQPMVLVEADTCGERKVGADAHEHSSPIPVVDVEVVLNDPALRELEVPSVRDLIADRGHDLLHDRPHHWRSAGSLTGGGWQPAIFSSVPIRH